MTGREGRSKTCPEQTGALIASARDMARLDRPEGRLVKVRAVNLMEEEPGWAGGERELTVYASYALWRTLVSPLYHRCVVQSVRVPTGTTTGTTRRYLAVAPVTVV